MTFWWDAPRKLRTDIILADKETHETFTDKLRFIFIELPSFKKTEEECETDFERWIYVLKNMDTLNRLPFKARKAVFAKLEQIVDIAALSKEERMRYDESIKVYRDHLATIAYAKTEGKEEGRAEGIAIGLETGREEGITIGMETGTKNTQKEIARKMLDKGMDINSISELSGLSIEEINGI